MSVSGISTTNLYSGSDQNVVSKRQEIQKEFQQLGEDITSGDLTAAQSDYTALQQLVPKLDSNTSSLSTDPRVKAFDQLEKDIQSGNLSAAQQDYANIQQMFQNRSEGGHHPHGGNGGSGKISDLFQQLGQALQSGDLSSAQQAFSLLQQDLQQNGPSSAHTGTQSTSGVSVTA
jgi:outer membrane protein assembly factor BamD (BamD/ComL family)